MYVLSLHRVLKSIRFFLFIASPCYPTFNFISVGEKQLISIIKAHLKFRKVKIVLL